MDSPPGVIDLYVRLLNEGTEVFRPANALSIGNGLYRILETPEYDPADEEWEFEPGALVRVVTRTGQSGTYLLAVRI